MANDLLILRCKVCGKCSVLYRYFPRGGYGVDPSFRERFVSRHLKECMEPAVDLEGHPFELHTEGSLSRQAGPIQHGWFRADSPKPS